MNSGDQAMDPGSFFHLQHGRVHSSNVSSVASLADRIFGGLTDEQMRVRPGQGLNSLVWLLWHMARVEDAAVNLVVTAGQQVLDDGWSPRLGVLRTDVGHGMTEDEVADFTARADIAAVRAYRDAVGLRTRDVAAALGPGAWAEILSTADAVRVPAGFRAFVGQPRAFELGTSAITHNAMHLGEAVTIRGLAGFPLA
ncbi:MAG: DinB family protein [Candidatus Rokubacteria bacterium]|nr:DinB family protein [Candidatus Rokubacteria bacterium]